MLFHEQLIHWLIVCYCNVINFEKVLPPTPIHPVCNMTIETHTLPDFRWNRTDEVEQRPLTIID